MDFHAKWCAPCKWMEQTTFVNPDVSDMMQQNYISLKVDIDDVSGYELKSQYKCKIPAYHIDFLIRKDCS